GLSIRQPTVLNTRNSVPRLSLGHVSRQFYCMAYPNDQTDAPPLHALNRLQWSRWSRADSNNSPASRIVSAVGDLESHRESHVCKHRNRDQPEIVDRRAPIHVRTTTNIYTH